MEGRAVSSLAQQASAVETAVRLIGGGAQKPSAREKEHIVNLLKAASITLRNLEYDEACQ